MSFRVTNTSYKNSLTSQIAASQQRVLSAQERITSGKRINRPSDDPAGAAAVIRLRNSQSTVEQFNRNAGAAKDRLLAGDNALGDYEQALDRTRTLLTQGASDFTSDDQRKSIATEIESLRTRILNTANSRNDEYYVFGGTRQNAPPFDANGIPATSATSLSQIQVEPNAPPVAVGVTGETVFSDANGTIFAALSTAITALRGTGDPAADSATLRASLDRLQVFTKQAGIAHAQIGVGLNQVEAASARLGRDSLSFETRAGQLESADIAESALELSGAQRALEAALQTGAQVGRRSLIDFLS